MVRKQQNEEAPIAVLDEEQSIPSESGVSMLDAALSQADKWQREETEARERETRQQWGEYLALLHHHDHPQPGDAETLANTILALGIDAARVGADCKLIIEARALTALHEQRQAAHQAAREAGDALAAVEARHKRELLDAVLKREHSRNHAAICSEAAHELGKLRRQRPQLFTTDEPPRLLGDS